MDKTNKQALIRRYSELFDKHKAVFFVRNSGLSVSDSRSIRLQLKASGIRFLFIKNSLAKISLGNEKALEASKYFVGPLAVVYSNNPLSLSRLLVKICKINDKLDITGGIDTGKIISKDEITTLSTMPTQEEIRVIIISLFNAAALKVVTIFNEPAIRIARVCQSYATKK